MSGEKEPKKGVWRAEHERQPIAGRLKKIPRQEQAHFDELEPLGDFELPEIDFSEFENFDFEGLDTIDFEGLDEVLDFHPEQLPDPLNLDGLETIADELTELDIDLLDELDELSVKDLLHD